MIAGVNIQSVAQRRKPSGHGGWRPGAGRPRVIQDPVEIKIKMEKADMDALRRVSAERGTSVAVLIRSAIRAHLKRFKR